VPPPPPIRKVPLGVVEAVNGNIKALLRRGCGYRDLSYLLLNSQRLAATKTQFIVLQKAAKMRASSDSRSEPPLYWSQGGLTTIRTDNSPSGAASGYYGLFFNKDDVAKMANFLNNSSGRIDGNQVLDLGRLKEALVCGAVRRQPEFAWKTAVQHPYGAGLAMAAARLRPTAAATSTDSGAVT